MSEEFDHIDDLIGKVLAGEATIEEQLLLNLWRNESDGNQRYYDQVKTIFEKAATNGVQLKFDEDAAWNNIKSKITAPRKQVFFNPIVLNFSAVLRIAAGIIVVLGISYFAFELFYIPVEQLAIRTDRQIINDTARWKRGGAQQEECARLRIQQTKQYTQSKTYR
jgi:hypothetical protein